MFICGSKPACRCLLPVGGTDDLIAKVESLASDPDRHRLAPESRRFPVEIRQLLFRKHRSQFRILFTISGNCVVILSVRHHSRKSLEEVDLPV
jgi:mRNA-degrading endonuclease RelE of RelBE toxin-antitoxin system